MQVNITIGPDLGAKINEVVKKLLDQAGATPTFTSQVKYIRDTALTAIVDRTTL